jgi:hypothetical protein
VTKAGRESVACWAAADVGVDATSVRRTAMLEDITDRYDRIRAFVEGFRMARRGLVAPGD